MSPLYFMVNRFSDIMEQRPRSRDMHVGTKLLGEHSGNMRHFNGVLQHILSIARPKMKPPQYSDDTRIKIKDATFIHRLFAFLFDDLIDIFTRLQNGLFYFCRLNSPVQYEVF